MDNVIPIGMVSRKPRNYSTLKVCNVLAGLLSDLDSALESANRAAGMPTIDDITKTLDKTRERVRVELALAKLRHQEHSS